MYYQTLKEMIDEIKKEKKIDGVTLKNKFIERYGGGSTCNMNKALCKLRRYKKVNYVRAGVKIYYWKK